MVLLRKFRNWYSRFLDSSEDSVKSVSKFPFQRSGFFSVKLITLLFLIVILLELHRLFLESYYYSQDCCSKQLEEEKPQGHKLRNNTNTPRIVLWTKYFGARDFGSTGLVENLTFKNCPSTCEVVFASGAATRLRQNDAIVFHARDLERMPKRHRHPDQVWVFLLQESPEHSPSLQEYDNIFNWTMTYRLDSDVHHPYGLVKPNPTPRPPPMPPKNASPTRKSLASIIVTHCNTPGNRESLLNDLQDFVPISIYGTCGNLTCPHDQVYSCPDLSCKFEQFQLCLARISAKYKFHFAFENSLCMDYISEKFYNVLKTDMVPVVYGGADYSLVAPPHSYINARDFNTAEELAQYLLYLDANDYEYMKYFEWKKKYYVDLTQYEGWCDLCTKLRSEFAPHQVYESIQTWWNFPAVKKAKAAATDVLTVKYARACEPKPQYLHKGWRDELKNALWR